VQLFVNSVDQEHGREWLETPADLAAWLTERELAVDEAPTVEDVERAHELREALRALLHANNGRAFDPAAVGVVNDAARRGGLHPAVDDRGAVRFEISEPHVDGALAGIVAVVVAAMLDGSWSRLKACRHCSWVFWDTSKNRSGSWCSMQLCGNRTKTRAYRRRKAAGGRA
jgi:predicted RNA-binding Zn ribbon-like protein